MRTPHVNLKDRGRGRGSERTGPYHHATRLGNDNDERDRRGQLGDDGGERRGNDFGGDPWTKARRGRHEAWRRGAEGGDEDGAAAARLTNADDGRERLDGGTNATTTGNDERTTTTTTTGTGEEATRTAGSGCTGTRTTRTTPLRCRRRRRRRETTSRATDGTSSTRTIGDDDDGPRRGLDGGEARPRATLPLRCRRWWRCGRPVHGEEGQVAEQLRRGGCRGSRRWRSGETEEWTRWRATPPRKGEMAAPADAWAWRKGQPGEMPPRRKEKPARATVFRRSSGEEEVMPGMRAASWSRGRWWRRRPALRGRGRGGRRRRSGGDATGRRRGRVSGAFPAKRRADRGRGGSCDAGRGGGAAGGCTGEAGGAAGGGRQGGMRRATAGVRLRRGGQAGVEEVAATLEEATARPDDALARRERRLEAGRQRGRERATVGSESSGFGGGSELGFTGEGERTAGREEGDNARPGAWDPPVRRRRQRAHARCTGGGAARVGPGGRPRSWLHCFLHFASGSCSLPELRQTTDDIFFFAKLTI
ncbi:B1135C02.7 [Oryza sativa (japonica cultivar-group)]